LYKSFRFLFLKEGPEVFLYFIVETFGMNLSF